MDDPVAAKSVFLSMYMSNHPDTLVAYVMQHTKNRQVVTASMTSIDSKGMHLSYTVKGSDVKNTTRVPFDPPLLGYEEVKPRLMAMKVDAEVDLGMAKNPTITTFAMPSLKHTLPTFSLQILLIWATFSTSPYGAIFQQFFGWQIIRLSWVILVAAHSAEASYMFHLTSKHKTPFNTKLLWCFLTLVLGWSCIVRYLRLVKDARIDSIMKGS
ncbi:hypothetical protein FRB96_007068 [Tulasnella sp. 330]|nr:hypothetical protein FRB96_007068 [Tulasnella sp. 330]